MNTKQINRQILIEIAKNVGNFTNRGIINLLKDAGVKVKIEHYRKNPNTGKEERYMRHERPFKPLAKGGFTEVTLNNDSSSYYGMSSCYYKDTFSYKLGTHRALIQALHNLIKDLG